MSTTTNLPTLKINYLTQAQYDAAVSGGTVNDDELYLTPSADYSTSEVNTGKKWIDGKPIYEKTTTVSVSTYSDTNRRRVFSTGDLITGVSEVIKGFGYIQLTSGTFSGRRFGFGQSALNGTNGDLGTQWTSNYTQVDDGVGCNFYIDNNLSWTASSVKFVVTLEYTKAS